MGNECFLASTTAHLPPAEQNLARYGLHVVEPPRLPVRKSPSPDEDGPDTEPNLWMWVNPNIVFPPGKLEVSQPRQGEGLTSILPSPPLPPKEEDCAHCSKADAVELLPAYSREQSPPRKQLPSSPSSSEVTGEEAKDQHDRFSVALLSPHKRAPLQSRRLQQATSQEGRPWPRPPLNYFHLIALALRNSPPCGLNVQQIYSFTRQHFPFFRTAPEGWKNTIRHNLCFRTSFEKVRASTQAGACLWRLTEEGRRRFEEEAQALSSEQLERIQQCMSQPGKGPRSSSHSETTCEGSGLPARGSTCRAAGSSDSSLTGPSLFQEAGGLIMAWIDSEHLTALSGHLHLNMLAFYL